MAKVARRESSESVLYAYMRRGEWAFGRCGSVGAELPNMAVCAWESGRLSDDDLTRLIFASYEARQHWVYENPYYADDEDAAEAQFRLEVYRAYRALREGARA